VKALAHSTGASALTLVGAVLCRELTTPLRAAQPRVPGRSVADTVIAMGGTLEPADARRLIRRSWPTDAASLFEVQEQLGVMTPPPWCDGSGRTVGGCFVAFLAGEAGPGGAGDRALVGAVTMSGRHVISDVVVLGAAGAAYEPGMLALREGPMLAAAVESLDHAPDVLLVDATGRDHPRRAGLAVHLGAVLDMPTVGVTHRTLRATGSEPGQQRGDTSPLLLDGDEVARWVRTRSGVRPVVAHAAWRCDVDTAVAVVMRTVHTARTPDPLRLARQSARTARARVTADRHPAD
jgi:deoxyribonuclease V